MELDLLELPPRARLGVYSRTLSYGLLASTLAALLIGFVPVLADVSEVSSDALGALCVTAGLSAIAFPLQNHARRLFHLAGRSGLAAGSSGVHFVSVVLAIWLLTSAGVDSPWIPFGALATGKLISSGAAVSALAYLRWRPERSWDLPISRIDRTLQRGKWMMLSVVIPQLTMLVAASAISRLASLAVLGQIEAARIITRPINLASVGLSASLGPRSMDAARMGSIAEAIRIRKLFLWTLCCVSLPYVLLVQARSPLNPFLEFVPTAFLAAGLVALQGLSTLLGGLGMPQRSELLALGAERDLVRVETLVAPLCLVVSIAVATYWPVYSIPVGFGTAGLARYALRVLLADRALRSSRNAAQ
jgi:hypothetical protein